MDFDVTFHVLALDYNTSWQDYLLLKALIVLEKCINNDNNNKQGPGIASSNDFFKGHNQNVFKIHIIMYS